MPISAFKPRLRPKKSVRVAWAAIWMPLELSVKSNWPATSNHIGDREVAASVEDDGGDAPGRGDRDLLAGRDLARGLIDHEAGHRLAHVRGVDLELEVQAEADVGYIWRAGQCRLKDAVHAGMASALDYQLAIDVGLAERPQRRLRSQRDHQARAVDLEHERPAQVDRPDVQVASGFDLGERSHGEGNSRDRGRLVCGVDLEQESGVQAEAVPGGEPSVQRELDGAVDPLAADVDPAIGLEVQKSVAPDLEENLRLPFPAGTGWW